MPEFDTVSTVRVDNMLRANDVVQLLLSKFRIENDPKGDLKEGTESSVICFTG